MAYQDNVEIYLSTGLKMRIVACLAIEGHSNPLGLLAENEWAFAKQPGWSDAWASGKAAHGSAGDLGVRGDVITDAMILSAAQSIFPIE